MRNELQRSCNCHFFLTPHPQIQTFTLQTLRTPPSKASTWSPPQIALNLLTGHTTVMLSSSLELELQELLVKTFTMAACQRCTAYLFLLFSSTCFLIHLAFKNAASCFLVCKEEKEQVTMSQSNKLTWQL